MAALAVSLSWNKPVSIRLKGQFPWDNYCSWPLSDCKVHFQGSYEGEILKSTVLSNEAF